MLCQMGNIGIFILGLSVFQPAHKHQCLSIKRLTLGYLRLFLCRLTLGGQHFKVGIVIAMLRQIHRRIAVMTRHFKKSL